MKLHEAMVLVLREKGHPMTTRELADEINMRKLYCRHDELPLPSSQIGARAKITRIFLSRLQNERLD